MNTYLEELLLREYLFLIVQIFLWRYLYVYCVCCMHACEQMSTCEGEKKTPSSCHSSHYFLEKNVSYWVWSYMRRQQATHIKYK